LAVPSIDPIPKKKLVVLGIGPLKLGAFKIPYPIPYERTPL